ARARGHPLLMLVVALWGVCFALNLRAVVRGSGFPPMRVTAPATSDGYPVVSSFLPWVAVAAPEIQVGDRVVRIGSADLRGSGPLTFFARFAEKAESGEPVPLEIERAGTRTTTLAPPVPVSRFAALLATSAIFAGVAVLLVLRARPSAMVNAFVWCFISVAL